MKSPASQFRTGVLLNRAAEWARSGTKKPLILLAAVTPLAVTVFAADLTGTWNAAVITSGGNGNPTFVLKQGGNKLTGTYAGQFGNASVSGTVKGGDVTIEFEVSGTKATYTGKVDSAETKIEGTCEYGGRASGTFTATKK